MDLWSEVFVVLVNYVPFWRCQGGKYGGPLGRARNFRFFLGENKDIPFPFDKYYVLLIKVIVSGCELPFSDGLTIILSPFQYMM